MKKVAIFLAIIIALFVGVSFLTKMQNEEKVADNPYGKDTLHPETVKLLDDPNYQNLILPDELDKRLENGEDLTVYFYASTCPHCQRTTPILAPLAEEMGVDVVQFNLLEFENGWDKYLIESTPTLVQFKGGKETARIVGYHEKPEFEAWLNENSKK
ncbi:thioredoxin family protein [Bacillus sp. 31A1R]|uniref:Thioredoxin family protein n=1 Tax=Robertmurraya mangrovi TaxID=3098077 RepID=A0ABU5J3L3_9BACI|nr:thioredoxin family protein [Bacillus sp. 31A1R]MDZ5473950.1 thioredoxin family protein [Bacillus sp. 31A1R]